MTIASFVLALLFIVCTVSGFIFEKLNRDSAFLGLMTAALITALGSAVLNIIKFGLN